MDNGYGRLIQQAMINIRYKGGRVQEQETAISTDDDPVVQLADGLMEQALTAGASDLHIESVADATRCRIRVDGQLILMDADIPVKLHNAIISRFKLMCGMDIAEHRIPQDGRTSFFFNGTKIDVRASVLPVFTGEKLVLRFFNAAVMLRDITELGFSETELETFRSICMSRKAVIISGPVNSGKTTTLYAVLKQMNDRKNCIVTIEDPVEYQLQGISQVQVNDKAGLTYASGLRACLRQDSDIIMVGEIRDEVTAGLVVRAALTGHSVYTTLHTGTSLEAVRRLMDMGVSMDNITATIGGVVAQRLVRRVCPHCRGPVDSGARETRGFYSLGTVAEPDGCDMCAGTGYLGRLAIHEIMPMTAELRKALLDGLSESDLASLMVRMGIKSLWDDGIEKAEQGLTDIREVRRVLGYGPDQRRF